MSVGINVGECLQHRRGALHVCVMTGLDDYKLNLICTGASSVMLFNADMFGTFRLYLNV